MAQEKILQRVADDLKTATVDSGVDGTSGIQEKSADPDSQKGTIENVTATETLNEASADENILSGEPEDTREYVKGWRKHLLTFG